MEALGDVLGSIIQRARENQSIDPSDYRGEDGLLYCGVCHERKEHTFTTQGKEFTVPTLCACGRKKREEEDRLRKAREEADLIARLKISSMMDAKFKEASFASYERTAESEKVYKLATRYAERFPEMYDRNQGLLFYGTVGTGKSYTAACIANALMDRATSCVMTSFVKILQDIRFTEDEAHYMSSLNRPKLLIIDDLGAERSTDYALEKVYNVVDSRVRSNKPMILTTNLTLKEMMDSGDIRYQRIYDRILEVCFPVEMSWKSFRRRTAAERFPEMRKLMED